MDFIAFSTMKIGPWVHFKVLLWFISKWVMVQLRVHQMNPGALPIEPRLTPCSRGCSTNTFVTHYWLINWVSQWSFLEIFPEHLQSQTVRARKLTFWEKVHLPLPDMCHMSHVMCPYFLFYFLFIILQNAETSWWRVCYQRGYPV